MKRDELIAAANAGLPADDPEILDPRQLRFLRSIGAIRAPLGPRASAEWDETHLADIARYRLLRRWGLSPSAIGEIISGGGLGVEIAPGVLLTIHREHIEGSLDAKEIAAGVERLIEFLNSHRNEKE